MINHLLIYLFCLIQWGDEPLQQLNQQIVKCDKMCSRVF